MDERPRPSPTAGCTASRPDWGTAVTVQAMVFGNMGGDCATGVAFTRNPSTGEAALYGEYLVNAQGEDVVAGIRTPRAVSEAGREASGTEGPSMERAMPEGFAALQTVMGRLERHYRDMQDVEFTVQQGTPLDPADPVGQAHRQGGAQDRRRHGARGAWWTRRRR